ncbi:MAG: hypothetical protein R3F62_29670 [Planctomycetota bacterium]
MRRALLPTLILSALLCGCPESDPQPAPSPAPEVPPAPLPEPTLDLGEGLDHARLSALLRDPPHLPASLRGVLARELALRAQRADALPAYREALARIGAELRAAGALGTEPFAPALEARRHAAGAALARASGADAPEFFATYVAPPRPAADAGLGRALRLAQAGRHTLATQRAALAAVLLPATPAQLEAALAAARAAETPPVLASALRAQGVDPSPLGPDAESLVLGEPLLQAVEAAHAKPRGDLDAELARLGERLAALDGKLDEVTAALREVASGVRGASAGFAAQVGGFVNDDAALPLAQRKARLQFAESALHDRRPVAERVAEVEDEAGPYRYVTPADRQSMKLALKQETERRKAIDSAFAQAGKATQAAGDVVDLLVSFDALPAETARDIHKGLDVTNAGLDLVTSVAMGDPLSAISAGADLCYLLCGKEPPPSPEEVRHEQVMQALDALAEGQREIQERLSAVSRQVEELHMELHQVHQIARSTHAIVVDQNLLGLRDCRDFLRSQRFYAVVRPDPLSGEPLARPDLGLADYGQFLAHFNKAQERELYTSASRFLNDQLRGKALSVLEVAADDEQAAQIRASIAQSLGQKPEWVRDQVLAEDAQSAALLSFVQQCVRPELRSRVLGSLAYPARDIPGLVAKLERILDPEASAPFVAAFTAFGLDEALSDATNPILVEEVVASAEALQPYRLIQVPGQAALPGFEALTQPGYDPARSFGATRRAQHEQLLEPLQASERLLRRCLAQNALRTGDVLIPLVAALTNYANPGINSTSYQAKLADRLLAENASLRENVVRFLVYLELKAPGRYPQMHELALKLAPERLGITIRYEQVEPHRELVQSSYERRVAAPAPRWQNPLGLRTRERVIRQGWPEGLEWEKFYRGLNLNGDLPESPSDAARALRQLQPALRQRVRGRVPLRRQADLRALPRPEEVVVGTLIQSSLVSPLEERRLALEHERRLRHVFPPDAAEEEPRAPPRAPAAGARPAAQ